MWINSNPLKPGRSETLGLVQKLIQINQNYSHLIYCSQRVRNTPWTGLQSSTGLTHTFHCHTHIWGHFRVDFNVPVSGRWVETKAQNVLSLGLPSVQTRDLPAVLPNRNWKKEKKQNTNFELKQQLYEPDTNKNYSRVKTLRFRIGSFLSGLFLPTWVSLLRPRRCCLRRPSSWCLQAVRTASPTRPPPACRPTGLRASSLWAPGRARPARPRSTHTPPSCLHTQVRKSEAGWTCDSSVTGSMTTWTTASTEQRSLCFIFYFIF